MEQSRGRRWLVCEYLRFSVCYLPVRFALLEYVQVSGELRVASASDPHQVTPVAVKDRSSLTFTDPAAGRGENPCKSIRVIQCRLLKHCSKMPANVM